MVCYKNEMNTIALRDFNAKEMDLFFAICSQMKEKKTQEITFSFLELKHLSNYKITSLEYFTYDLENIYKKLIKLSFRFEDENIIENFVLFNGYRIDKTRQTISVCVHSKFEFILNQISANFTKFELSEFVKINSSYSKTAYRLLKQFKNTGYAIFELDDFKNRFCIPKSYRMSDINRQVLTPIKKELDSKFKNLKIEKIKKGKSITHIEFYFQIEKNKKDNNLLKLEEINENLELKEKIISLKNAIPTLEEDEINILVETADIPIILEKYYTLAIGKDINNLTGFLMAAIKNNWKKSPSKTVEKKAVAGEMDELERKLQKRLFDKLNQRKKDPQG